MFSNTSCVAGLFSFYNDQIWLIVVECDFNLILELDGKSQVDMRMQLGCRNQFGNQAVTGYFQLLV